MGSKVTIIGGGRVGTSAAFAMLLRDTTRELVIFDRDVDRMKGEQLDLQHSLAFLATTKILATDSYEDTQNSNVIVFTAGAAQEPGESRLDLAKKNTEILTALLPEALKYSPEAVVLIVANPVDILTYQATTLLHLPKGRIFGTGTSLDSARFRFYLSELLEINPKNIHAYILGEHGDSSFPLVSTIDIGGESVLAMPGVTKEKIEGCFVKARDAAQTIISSKGSTSYAIGVVVNQLVHAILGDTRRIFPVSIPLSGEYGYSDVSISVPCILGKNGVEKILEISLAQEEKVHMETSVNVLKSFLQ